MTNLFKLFAISAIIFLSGNIAFAEPMLKKSIVVSSKIVTVGDMFENAGINAERALFRAPAPSTTGSVSLSAIRIATKKIGMSDFNDMGLFQVQVQREGISIDKEDLKQIIISELDRRGFLSGGVSAQLKFDIELQPLYAQLSDNPVKLLDFNYLPASNGFSLTFQLAGENTPRRLTGQLNLMIKVPHLSNTLQAGAIISPSDIKMRSIPLRYAQSSGFADIEQLVGKQIRRATRVGTMLRSSDVSEPELIGRSDFVTIYYRKGPLTLSVKGQALNSAAKGEIVSVLNLSSKNIVRGTAIAPGAVEINSNSLKIANTQG